MTEILLPKVVLKRKAAELENMSDRDFFTRSDFQIYLNQTLKAIVSASKSRKIRLLVFASDDGLTGCTDGEKVLINVLAPFIQKLKTRKEKLFAIIGLLTHECGHILYTDMAVQQKFLEDLRKGICRGQPDVEKMLAEGTPQFREYAFREVGRFGNLISDDYAEHRILTYFCGLPAACMRYTRSIADEYTMEILRKQFGTDSTYENVEGLCLLQVQAPYSTSELKDLYPERYKEAEPFFNRITDLMMDIRKSKDIVSRIEIFKAVVSVILPLIKEDFDEQIKQAKENAGEKNPQGQENSQDNGSENLQGQNDAVENREIKPDGHKCVQINGQDNGSQGQDNVPENSQGQKNEDASSGEASSILINILAAQLKKLEQESQLLGRLKPDGTWNGQAKKQDGTIPCGESMPDPSDALGFAKEELESMRIAEEESAMDETDRMLKVKRNVVPDADMVSKYNRQLKSVQPLITRTVRLLNNELKERQLEGRLTGQLYGKRMDTRQLYRSDGRLYTKELVPDGAPKVAFGVRIDESGSMAGNRIDAARKTAIALEAIFRELNVPHCIYGDTADEEQAKDVVIRKYAEFDAYDDNDRYRLADISSRSDNHDAYAIRFVANALKKRPEPQKILIVVSDGMPAAIGFDGRAAVKKTAETVAEIEKEGISVYAAALSGCYKSIEGIYGKDRVMDINNLDQLPRELTKIIKKYCLKRWG